MGFLAAGIGLALIIVSFLTWGRITATGEVETGVFGSVSISFPGLGDPSFRIKMSDGGTSLNGDVDSPALRALHTDNPGWITLLLGVIAIIGATTFLWLHQRVITGVVLAGLGGIAGIVCISYMLDLSGTFGDPPGLSASHFAPGFGLVAGCGLSFGLSALGIFACLSYRRAQAPRPGY
ncbi:hypothetical protein [Mycobacterium sp. 23]|uniref:hypothetical protein n=1 Tax=Mycobacterium sp. 23 TaxID=3400424 RepID=UPI003AACF569